MLRNVSIMAALAAIGFCWTEVIGGQHRDVQASEMWREVEILQSLAQPTTVEFVETPLSQVIDFLKDKHKIEIQFDQKALNEAAITTDTPVTRILNGGSLKAALNLILADLDLTWIVRNEVLLITTAKVAEKEFETRVYDVSDLVTQGGGAEVERLNALPRIIQQTVLPHSWMRENTPCTVAAFASNDVAALVVFQTFHGHLAVSEVLADLRKLKRQGIAQPDGSRLPPEIERPQAQSVGGVGPAPAIETDDPFAEPQETNSNDPFGDEPNSTTVDPFE